MSRSFSPRARGTCTDTLQSFVELFAGGLLTFLLVSCVPLKGNTQPRLYLQTGVFLDGGQLYDFARLYVSKYAKVRFLDERVTHGVTFFLGSPESPTFNHLSFGCCRGPFHEDACDGWW